LQRNGLTELEFVRAISAFHRINPSASADRRAYPGTR
jgi:hypothetical protein